MMSPDSENAVCLVLCNAPDAEVARHLASVLLEQQLAACVNILPASLSLYRWQGAIERCHEVPMLIKTTHAAWPALQNCIVQHHPYQVPEILCVPLTQGLPPYLAWVKSEVVVAAPGVAP